MSNQLSLHGRAGNILMATLRSPPVNLIDPGAIEELQVLVQALETDPDVRVIVFRSADPNFSLRTGIRWQTRTELAQ